jgi:hypothetical protein
MKRDEIYEWEKAAICDETVTSRLSAASAIPNVDYWLVNIKGAAAELDRCLDQLSVKAADWGATLSTCILCMMQNGVVRRGIGPLAERVIVRGPATFNDVMVAINGERDYQDALPPNRVEDIERPHTVYGYSIMFDTYLRRAIDAWTGNAGVYHSLDEIRKLAGICVHCLEDCY